MLRFESEPVRLGSQREIMASGKIDSLFQAVKEQGANFFSHPWIITDVDNTLLGNPYAN